MAKNHLIQRLVKPEYPFLINGRHSDGSGALIPVFNPATGEQISSLHAADEADVDRAVQAARASFERGIWRDLPASRQAEVLWRLSDLIESQADDLAALETIDCGMPISRTRTHLGRAVEALRYYAGMCTKIHGRTSELRGLGFEVHAYTRNEPVGVAGLITPWNGPLLVVCNKTAPALAAGCSVVIKPPEQASLSALRFAELALEAGVPAGVVNVVTGLGHSTGAALAGHRDVDKISFTGSTAVGKRLVEAAAGNLKRLSLELGGKSPVFIFDDADMSVALPAAFRAIFANSGQVCVAGSRLYVQRNSVDHVVNGLAELARATRMGDGLDPATEFGPLISCEQQARVLNYVESGLAEGAELVCGGKAPDSGGYFVEPTIFVGANRQMKMVREEIFGPVLNIMPFDDADSAPEIGNDTQYGLAAGIFTQDVNRVHRLANRLRAGNVWVNCYGMMDYSMPFGGFGESGWGRENGWEGLDAFIEKKSVYIATPTNPAPAS